MRADRKTEGQGDRTKLLVAVRNFANLPTKATFILGTAGVGNTFVDGGHDRNINGDTNLLFTNVCAIHSLP
jgi:hypothetical protein